MTAFQALGEMTKESKFDPGFARVPAMLEKFLERIPRSHAEKGLLKTLTRADKNNPFLHPPESLSNSLRSQIKAITTRPVDVAEHSGDIGKELGSLQNQLMDAIARERITRPPKDFSWWSQANRQRKLGKPFSALLGEQKRLSKLGPGQLSREKYRMQSLEAMKAPPTPTPRQMRIQELAENIRNPDPGYW
jgi:hypothetical protein